MKNHVLSITRTFKNVPPERVYMAWTDPDLVAQWYGPEGFTNTIHEMSVNVGGSYRITMQSPDGNKHSLRGRFIELNPPKKIVLTWQWENPETSGNVGTQETRVTVTFKKNGTGTEMRMVHDKFANDEQVSNHSMGWSSSFNKLDRTVSRNA